MIGVDHRRAGLLGLRNSAFFQISRIRVWDVLRPKLGLIGFTVPCFLAPIFLSALLSFSATARAAEPNSSTSLVLLTNARQVLNLGVEGARRSPHPVKL